MWKITLSLLLMAAVETNGQTVQTALDRTGIGTPSHADAAPDDPVEPHYLGRPLAYWLKSIQNRDNEMDLAFDAIRHMGPDAASAVPELTSIITQPLPPIAVGVDTYAVVTSKLAQIQLRSNAVDCLAAIGKPAAGSAMALAKWALATKVVLGKTPDRREQNVFIDLVGIDVLERMRVAGAIAQFSPQASLVVAELLKSPDGDARKLGVAILSERALPISTALLKSNSCSDRQLGLKMLADMWPVVARDHLLDLDDMISCAQTAGR